MGGGVHLYGEPWFILLASIDYAYAQFHDLPGDQGGQNLSGTAGLGLRKGDNSLELSYTQAAQRSFGSFTPLQRGPILLTLTTLVSRRLLASLTAEAIRGGGVGSLAGAYFPKPRLAFMASALAAHGALLGDVSTVTRIWDGGHIRLNNQNHRDIPAVFIHRRADRRTRTRQHRAQSTRRCRRRSCASRDMGVASALYRPSRKTGIEAR